MSGSQLGRAAGQRWGKGHQRQVWKRRCRIRVMQGASAVISGSSHRGRDFRDQEDGDDDRISSLLDSGENLQALAVTAFMRIKRIHEHTRVHRVA
jgi:hypothetical protein